MNLLSDGLQKNLQNEKLKGSEKQNSTTGFTVIKVHNETNWNGSLYMKMENIMGYLQF